MLQVRSWPSVILHLDGDAFFSSVIQALHPQLKGKPLVTGRERGIAVAVSYEAQKYGVKRCMTISQVRKLCPQCIVMSSDYSMYSLFSHKMFDILRKYSPHIEEYSIDEAFADIKGLQRPLNMNYKEIGQAVKNEIEKNLGITISVGVSLTKSLAKLASSYRKPSGLTVVEGRFIEQFLQNIPIKKVWGIGDNTGAYLQKIGLDTVGKFVAKPESFIIQHLSKPYWEIWRELRGEMVFMLDTATKDTYKSIQDTGTFWPATNDPDILWARLLSHIENAFEKARRYGYSVQRISIFLKTQKFTFHSTEIKLPNQTVYPYLIHDLIKKYFLSIHKKGVLYRATGCTISDLEESTHMQSSLFDIDTKKQEKVKKIYPLFEDGQIDFGSSLFTKKKKPKHALQNLDIPLLS